MSLFSLNKACNKAKITKVHNHTPNAINKHHGANNTQKDPPVFNPNHKYSADIINTIRNLRLKLMVASVASIIYSKELINKSQWDEYSNQLIVLQDKYPNESRFCVYYQLFKDFDGAVSITLTKELWANKTAQELITYNNL